MKCGHKILNNTVELIVTTGITTQVVVLPRKEDGLSIRLHLPFVNIQTQEMERISVNQISDGVRIKNPKKRSILQLELIVRKSRRC